MMVMRPILYLYYMSVIRKHQFPLLGMTCSTKKFPDFQCQVSPVSWLQHSSWKTGKRVSYSYSHFWRNIHGLHRKQTQAYNLKKKAEPWKKRSFGFTKHERCEKCPYWISPLLNITPHEIAAYAWLLRIEWLLLRVGLRQTFWILDLNRRYPKKLGGGTVHVHEYYTYSKLFLHGVDGRNPAPPGM